VRLRVVPRYCLGSCIIFAKDFIEHEREEDGYTDLQINGIANFVMLSTSVEA